MDNKLTPDPEQTLQPTPMTMSFYDALRRIKEGKRVSRIAWGNSDYCVMDGEWLAIFTKGKLHTWQINDGDMEGEDWIVVTTLN